MRKELTRMLSERQKELRKMIFKRRAKNLPEGRLRISMNHGQPRYYLRGEGDKEGTYLLKNQRPLARKIVQQEYEDKVNREARAEMKCIERCLKQLSSSEAPEEIYGNLHPERQKLITPVVQTDEMFAKEWQGKDYSPMEKYQEHQVHETTRNEMVRSKSEMIIAEFLYKEGIPYRYEQTVYLRGYGEVHPDFTALNVRLRKEYFWEHLGRLDDPEYLEDNIGKINAYIRNGYIPGKNLIVTYETKQMPLNSWLVEAMIREYLL